MTRQGNPKDSKWRSTPNAARVNKNVMLTLPPDEREKLDRLAKAWGCPRSVAVARLVREAEEGTSGKTIADLAVLLEEEGYSPALVRAVRAAFLARKPAAK